MTAALRLLRPNQATKNLFIFIPLFFGQELGSPSRVWSAVQAFAAFTLLAWAVYIYNDLQDRDSDRLHPVKKSRPLVDGSLSPGVAWTLLLGLAMAGLGGMAAISPRAFWILLLYAVLNIGYSLGLKHIPVLDVATVALGYVFRVQVGGAVTSITPSAWLVVMTFLLALFLALAKRRDDMVLFMETGTQLRRSIDGYSLPFLDGALALMGGVVIVAYVSYALAPDISQRLGTEHFHFTTFFVVLGILRYLQVATAEGGTGDPTDVLFRDRFLQLTLLGWLGTCLWLLYG